MSPSKLGNKCIKFKDTIVLQCTCIHILLNARTIVLIMQILLSLFAEVKVLQQQNMLNVHHIHTLVCNVFKLNYEQHLCGHSLIPMVYRFVSSNVPLKYAIKCQGPLSQMLHVILGHDHIQ